MRSVPTGGTNGADDAPTDAEPPLRSSPVSAPRLVEGAETDAPRRRLRARHRRRRSAGALYVAGDAPLLVAPAAAVLAEHGAALSDVKLGIPTLEDVFIDLTGRALR